MVVVVVVALKIIKLDKITFLVLVQRDLHAKGMMVVTVIILAGKFQEGEGVLVELVKMQLILKRVMVVLV